MPTVDERANRERVRRRTHLVRLRTSATNRIFGLLTQWGMRRSLKALRAPDALEDLVKEGVPAVWRQSIGTLLALIADLDAQIKPLEKELRVHARQDERAKLLMTIPGIAELLGLTFACEIGDVTRFPTACKLVGYSGLTPRITQSGVSSRIGQITRQVPRRCAGPPSRRPNRPTVRPAPGIGCGLRSRPATAAKPTRPKPRSPAKS